MGSFDLSCSLQNPPFSQRVKTGDLRIDEYFFIPVSVIDTKQSFASSLIVIFLIEELVEVSEGCLLSAVMVVPPVTDEVLLREDCAIRTEETVGFS